VQEGEWKFEWSYDKPAAPWAYEMTAVSIASRAAFPISWKLKAKLNEGDEWTLLDEQKDNNQWCEPEWNSISTKFDIRVKNQPWQYYRLEVTKKSAESDDLTIENFKLLY
jgi:hypothetical protein